MPSLELLLLLVLLLLIGLLVITVRRIDQRVNLLEHHVSDASDNIIRQIEALIGIYATLRPSHPLPKSRGWAASPDFLCVLIEKFNETQPSIIIECSSGYSTLVLAACAKNRGHGHVFSLEHDPDYAEQTRIHLAAHALNEYATIILAPLTEQGLPNWRGHWYSLEDLRKAPPAQMLVVDGPPFDSSPLARFPAVPLLWGRLSPGALIIIDDAARRPEMESVARWLQEFPDISLLESPTCEKGCRVLRKGE